MAKRLRKITVNDTDFVWAFSGRWRDGYRSQLTILSADRAIKIVIKFISLDTLTAGNPLNEGLYMEKEGTGHKVNLNQPKYVAELIAHLFSTRISDAVPKTYQFNGNQLLFELGYQDTERLLTISLT